MQQSPNRLNYKHWLYDFSVTNSITDNNLKTQIEVTGKRSCISKQKVKTDTCSLIEKVLKNVRQTNGRNEEAVTGKKKEEDSVQPTMVRF